MPSISANSDGPMGGGTGRFSSTHWSLVLQAGHASPAGRAAMETLCARYWYPLYAFVRRQGHPPHGAQDLTQAFFAHLLAKDFLSGVAPEKGRFRSYLLACLKHFLADEWDKLRARKRGAGVPAVSLDDTDSEGRYQREPADLHDPETLYERRWALTLLDRVLDRLEEEFVSAGKQAWFARLQPILLDEENDLTYRDLAAEIGSTEGAVKMTVHRMRQRYRELFRDEIAQTVASPDEIEEEIRHLLRLLGG